MAVNPFASYGNLSACLVWQVHEIYLRVFQWVVRTINQSLRGPASIDESQPLAVAAASEGEGNFIAILDIFGFEKLETNSLEQLLINHTNERLQLFFLQRTVQVPRALM